MSYAIIRNEKYTKDEMIQLAPHNERFKKKYSNKNIDLSKTSQNYHLKRPQENSYLKEYQRLIKENNLNQGQLHKNSIYVCEVILTSDNTFFNEIGKKETKRYFEECFKFMTEYKGIGKENTNREHISNDDMKKSTNFYNTKQLKKDLKEEKEQMITYQDVQDFYKYEDFTKDNIDKKLIYPILKYNNSLVKQNHNLLLELSKAKNAKKYYLDLQIANNQIINENRELEDKLKMNHIELNACYDIIKELLYKNEKIEKILKDKLGIAIVEDKDNVKSK